MTAAEKLSKAAKKKKQKKDYRDSEKKGAEATIEIDEGGGTVHISGRPTVSLFSGSAEKKNLGTGSRPSSSDAGEGISASGGDEHSEHQGLGHAQRDEEVHDNVDDDSNDDVEDDSNDEETDEEEDHEQRRSSGGTRSASDAPAVSQSVARTVCCRKEYRSGIGRQQHCLSQVPG